MRYCKMYYPDSYKTLYENSPMPFGKYKNIPLYKVPADYLLYIIKNYYRIPYNLKLYIARNYRNLLEESA